MRAADAAWPGDCAVDGQQGRGLRMALRLHQRQAALDQLPCRPEMQEAALRDNLDAEWNAAQPWKDLRQRRFGPMGTAGTRTASVVFERRGAPQSATNLAIEVQTVFEDLPARLRRDVEAALPRSVHSEGGQQLGGGACVHVHHSDIQGGPAVLVKRR